MEKFKTQDIKQFLNPAQWDAVSTIDGPLLVVAGAGTGKTRVIEYRCLYMIEKGIAPEQILLLTFTRKAAREMLSRASLHDPRCRKIEGGTFHSFAYRLIRQYKSALGLGEIISFLDESDSSDLLHLLSAKAGFLEEKSRFPKKDTLRSVLSMSINRNQPIREVLAKDYPHFVAIAHQLEDLRKMYTQFKVERNLIDYDDMLIYLKFLLETPAINEKVASHFRYCMVDEFQDTNKIQADIVYALARRHNNCMAVGDDTQSIYSFRGAYYKNMFDFPRHFPDTRIIKLEYNYRSTQPILDVANAVIEGEKQKYSKVLFTTRPGDEKPTLSYFKDAFTEAEWVAHRVKELRDDGTPLGSIGVLYRSNYLSLPVQLALSKLNIPFAVFGGMKFIETAHVKDVLAFLKAHHNPKDEISIARILMLLEGVGPRTAERVRDLILNLDAQALEKDVALVIKSTEVRRDVLKLAELFRRLAGIETIDGKIKKVIQFYTPILKKKFDDYPARQEDLEAFVEIAAGYASLEQFLVDFVTIEPPERSRLDGEGKKEDERPVTLSTVHSAKGLEWDAVFLIALVDGSIPVSYALDDDDAIEEERRLLYVAVTRARKQLHLSLHNEGRNGGMHSFNRLSRFISEPRVLEKIKTDYVWYEDAGFRLDDSQVPRMGKEGLYQKLAEYFDDDKSQDYF
ncbi:MAG: ATP-dependent helicase [Candidatus Omnitrophica bacterium]|nr:ATP-dependent helicase [Candidatus Omnitrophota bacterium]MDD5574858.1 ATP-dependent helicase [Candidatus Omnitrophota bacterium]